MQRSRNGGEGDVRGWVVRIKGRGEVDCVLDGRLTMCGSSSLRCLDWCKGGERVGGRRGMGAEEAREAEEGREMATCSPRPRNALAKIDYAAPAYAAPAADTAPVRVAQDVTFTRMPARRRARSHGNDGPTGYESDVEHAKSWRYVADIWFAVLHDPGTYIGRAIHVARDPELSRPRELMGDASKHAQGGSQVLRLKETTERSSTSSGLPKKADSDLAVASTLSKDLKKLLKKRQELLSTQYSPYKLNQLDVEICS
ncbi:hypothetical protein B0H11DRAFT_2187476 [Mycena galericulata]|nr:hypothetical protein B0H11DRAFT_2187476 [Mycena galericulata]